MKSLVRLLAGIIVLAAAGAGSTQGALASGGPQFSIAADIHLAGHSLSPTGMNKNGDVVGFFTDGTDFNGSPIYRPFYFHNGKLKNLMKGQTQGSGQALGINDAGLIVGYENGTTLCSGECAVEWPQGGSATVLPGPGEAHPGTSLDTAWSVNTAGEVVGASNHAPVRFDGTPATVPEPANMQGALLEDVNNSGMVVGVAFPDLNSGAGIVYYAAANTATSITPPVAGATGNFDRYVINNTGHIFGTWGQNGPSGMVFMYTISTHKWTRLGKSLGSFGVSAANDSNQVVGPVGNDYGYVSGGKAYKLSTLVPGAQGKYFMIGAFAAMNNAGEMAVMAQRNGTTNDDVLVLKPK